MTNGLLKCDSRWSWNSNFKFTSDNRYSCRRWGPEKKIRNFDVHQSVIVMSITFHMTHTSLGNRLIATHRRYRRTDRQTGRVADIMRWHYRALNCMHHAVKNSDYVPSIFLTGARTIAISHSIFCSYAMLRCKRFPVVCVCVSVLSELDGWTGQRWHKLITFSSTQQHQHVALLVLLSLVLSVSRQRQHCRSGGVTLNSFPITKSPFPWLFIPGQWPHYAVRVSGIQ